MIRTRTSDTGSDTNRSLFDLADGVPGRDADGITAVGSVSPSGDGDDEAIVSTFAADGTPEQEGQVGTTGDDVFRGVTGRADGTLTAVGQVGRSADGKTVDDYRNSEGEVTLSGLSRAATDYAAGEIGLALLSQVAAAYASS